MKVLSKYNHAFFQEQLDKIIEINKPMMLLFINEPWKNKYVLFYEIWKQYYKECIFRKFTSMNKLFFLYFFLIFQWKLNNQF